MAQQNRQHVKTENIEWGMEMKESLDVLVPLIVKWAEDRNLIEGSNPQAQMLKLTEEMGELAAGIAKGNLALAEDSLGDMMVVMIILAKQLDLELGKCLYTAYEEIKDRKGRMIEGVFVREV